MNLPREPRIRDADGTRYDMETGQPVAEEAQDQKEDLLLSLRTGKFWRSPCSTLLPRMPGTLPTCGADWPSDWQKNTGAAPLPTMENPYPGADDPAIELHPIFWPGRGKGE